MTTPVGVCHFIPLKNLSVMRIKFFNKLPVTYLKRAPLWGADSNIHWYKY